MNPIVSAASPGAVDPPRVDIVDALLSLRSTMPEYMGSGWSGAPAQAVDALEMAADPHETDRDHAAVTRSLGWAEESAGRGDYLDALGWIGVVEALGAELPTSFQIKRLAWGHALATSEPRGDEGRE